MSKAPDRCLYCNDQDPNCGFCDNGKPLDTQDDWNRSWGKIFDHTLSKRYLELKEEDNPFYIP